MKFLQIGLGSMGKRRIRNLQYLGYNDIVGFDLRKDRCEEASNLYGIKTIDAIDSVDWNEITHVVISTPPDQHSSYVLLAAKENKHVFIEASVVDDDFEEIVTLSKESSGIIFPSYTMRFDPINVYAKKLIEDGRIGDMFFSQHHFGLNLHKWHPYESINDFYVSKKRTGAAREIVPFDLVYISWLCGKPKKITAMNSSTKSLGVDIDDIYCLNYRTESNCLVQFTIDVVSQVPYRTTRIVGSKGNIEIDTVSGTIKYYSHNNDTWDIKNRSQLSVTKSTEEMYVLEMQEFLRKSEIGDKHGYTVENDWEILSFLYAAEESIESMKVVEI